MAFVASSAVALGAGAKVLLPLAVDVGGSAPAFTLFSHARFPGGTTYTWDSGQVLVIPATTDTVVAIPTGATAITATAASTVQLGQMLS